MAGQDDDNNISAEGGLTIAEPLRRAIGERYLQYALSTIMHRALPDARLGIDRHGSRPPRAPSLERMARFGDACWLRPSRSGSPSC